MMLDNNRKGQVTMFVIIAIIIVGIIGLFFAFRGNLFGDNIPASLQPVYARYSECISEEARNGLSLLSTQGGRIDTGNEGYANDFNPFSTHMNFLGLKIPYWYGYTENNLVIENVPTTNEMEDELAGFIAGRVNDCDLTDFYGQGFNIEKSEADVTVNINDADVMVSVNAPLAVNFGEDSARKTTHDVTIDSLVGKLHEDALTIYNSERESLFLENYALDALQSYAPVDGVEIQCSPKIWKTQDVINELQQGLSANIASISFGESNSKYFNVANVVNEEVNIIYLPEQFPSKIEVTPATQTLMIAEPVGNQEGMGVMGFCYVPYHFVYDVRFPVLIQVGDGVDSFQFPMVVDIDNNVVRGSEFTPISDEPEVDVCAFSENDITVNTYDINLNPIDANVSYKCFDSVCNLGQTTDGVLNAKVPACVNGNLIGESGGYAPGNVLFSSNSLDFAELVLEKEYDLDVEVRLDGRIVSNTTAVINFVSSDDYSANAIIPESTSIKLKEGLYNIDAFVYGGSNIVIPASTKTECFNVNKGGIAGFFGSKEEKCVSVEIPSTKIDYALRGGGKLADYYILESELESGKIVIDVTELPKPTTLEQLQYNLEVFDTLRMEVSFV